MVRKPSINSRHHLEAALNGEWSKTNYHLNHGFIWNKQIFPNNEAYVYWNDLDVRSRREKNFQLPEEAASYIRWLLRDKEPFDPFFTQDGKERSRIDKKGYLMFIISEDEPIRKYDRPIVHNFDYMIKAAYGFCSYVHITGMMTWNGHYNPETGNKNDYGDYWRQHYSKALMRRGYVLPEAARCYLRWLVKGPLIDEETKN